MPERRPVMLVILDGWGWRENPTDNALRQAHTPALTSGARARMVSAHLREGRGLPDGQMGNSKSATSTSARAGS